MASPSRRIRAVIFDLDNTLVDSRIDYVGMKRSAIDELVRLGVEPEILSESRTIVTNLVQGKEFLSRNTAMVPEDVDARINDVLTRSEMQAAHIARPIPGAIEAVAEISAMGFAIGILTRGSRAYTGKVLASSGLDGRLDLCVCRDDYPLEEAKPNPLAMERAAALLGASAKECLYSGDHLMDMECAMAAGSLFVGVLTGHTNLTDWASHGCERVVPSVRDLPAVLRSLSQGAAPS